MNPFEAPPKPPKRYESVASVKPKNPFDDEAEEETVTFHTLHRSTDHHATRSPMCSERHQSTTHANRSEQRVLNGKRTFGGSIQPASAQSNGGRPDSLLSKAREQFKRVSAGVSNQRDSSNYSALSTHSGRSTPLLPHARDIESQQQDSTRSPLAPVSPVGPPLKDTSSEAQNSNKSTFSNQGIRQNRSKAAAPEPCDNSSDSDEEDGLQLTDVGLRNGSMNSRNSTSSTNSTNSTRSSERVSSTRSKDMTRASEQSRPAGNDSTPGKKKVKKQRKAKVRKTIFCVDPHDENAVVRHLISGRGIIQLYFSIIHSFDLSFSMFYVWCSVYGYPHTYGGRLSNFRYYVQYNHPLLSIYFTHPLHPFSRRQRFIVFLCALSFAVCFSFILMATPLVPVVRQ